MTRSAFALAAVASLAGPQAGPLDRLGWLAGCWEMKRGTRTTLEM